MKYKNDKALLWSTIAVFAMLGLALTMISFTAGRAVAFYMMMG